MTARPQVRRALTAITAAMVVTVLLAAGGRWLTHADALPSSGNQVTVPTAVGRTVWMSAAISTSPPRDGRPVGARLQLRQVTPHVLENSSGATVDVLLCRRNADPVAVGAQFDPPPRQCASIEPFRSADVILSQRPGGAELLVRVTPHRPGLVRIGGLDISYRTGLRTGSQRSGMGMVVPTR